MHHSAFHHFARSGLPEGSASAKALDYSLRRWEALTRFVDEGQLPADNNWIENQIRPIAIGRNNWLFAILGRWMEQVPQIDV